MVETEVVRQCFKEGKLMDLHYEFTEAQHLKNPNIRRIFEAMRKVYKKGEIPDLVDMFSYLPEETRQQDIGFCMNLICENDRKEHKIPIASIHSKKFPRLEYEVIEEKFGDMSLHGAFAARERLYTEKGE